MDSGRIVESGSHTELMQSGGMYAEMFKAQSQAYVAMCE
ncbi:MAG: ABC transporter ATP-binding protein [Ruminococcaceae bacterium]|nr:ABC transporter ATP-binding protein [Oscillospiraceae bacterium]